MPFICLLPSYLWPSLLSLGGVVFKFALFSGESPLTERELNLAEVVVDKWKCYQWTSLRVGGYMQFSVSENCVRLLNFNSPLN